jgi:hypothetical protein
MSEDRAPTRTLRELYHALPENFDQLSRDRWGYPIWVELDGSRPADSNGFAQRARVVGLTYDDERGRTILRTEA